jgi:hypothetical protein
MVSFIFYHELGKNVMIANNSIKFPTRVIEISRCKFKRSHKINIDLDSPDLALQLVGFWLQYLVSGEGCVDCELALDGFRRFLHCANHSLFFIHSTNERPATGNQRSLFIIYPSYIARWPLSFG